MEATLAGLVLDGKYRLTVPLGEGGMGVVYAAQHVLLGKLLAVKLLKPKLASEPVALARFQQEAQEVSRLGSPHIVQVLDLGAAPDGSPFMVMELLEGETLYARLLENPQQGTNEVLPVPTAANIAAQILLGLHAAHTHGIIHRDLKPGNVFLTRTPDRSDFVKLLDFGLAKVLGGDRIAHMTRTGVLLGTPTYMAPEQVLGRKDVDHRADLWATGIVLFRMLVGRRPHEGRSAAERMAAITAVDAPPLRHFRPDLDPTMEALIRRALTRDPAGRFQSAEEFRIALLPWLPAGSPALATPATPGAAALVPPPPALQPVPPTVVMVTPTRPDFPATAASAPPSYMHPAAAAPRTTPVDPAAPAYGSYAPYGGASTVGPTLHSAPLAAADRSRARLLLWIGLPAFLVVSAAVVLLLARPWESRPDKSGSGAYQPGDDDSSGFGKPKADASAGAGSLEVTTGTADPAAPDAGGKEGAPPAKVILQISVPRADASGRDGAPKADGAPDADHR